MIFDSNLNDYEIIKERLLIKQNEFIVEKMNRIIEYAKVNAVDAKQKMTIKVNKIRLSSNFEKKICLIKSSSHQDNSFIRQAK